MFIATGWLSAPVSRAKFYPVFESQSSTEMEKLILELEKQENQKAYLGALKMKLSGLQKGPSTKINTFKIGRKLLETEITNHPNDIELRFLRFAVQEHAPKIVKYNKNLEADKIFIESSFKSAPNDLQIIIKQYASNSTALSSSNLR